MHRSSFTSVTLSEKLELSESVGVYFGKASPSQLDEVAVKEQEHRPVLRPCHPIRESTHRFNFFRALICL